MESINILLSVASKINEEIKCETNFTEDNACYMLAYLTGPICPSCGVRSSPCWRPWKQDGLKIRVCNACGIKYYKGQYCYYCNKTINKNQYKNIYVCYKCGHCDHRECVGSNGVTYISYTCILCRKSRY